MGWRPLPLRIYTLAADLLAPIAYRRVRAKLLAHGTGRSRLRERIGHATAARPDGRLIWFHAASVGESLSVLRLIAHLGQTDANWHFLITSGTATSGKVLADRLPPRCQHQFAPLDSRAAVGRFLAHWRPDLAIFVESEFWPQMLGMTHAAGVPMALLNARISDRSMRGWKRFGRTARHLLGMFSLIHCQDRRTEANLHDLGLVHARAGRNLKSLSGPLPHDAEALARMRAALGTRPVWLASSTHPGEDEIVLAAHANLIERWPELLLILVPRHPERAPDIEALIAKAGLCAMRRASGALPEARTQVYLADTLGETGLWYRLSPITCLCGSFVPVGGHNPYEPAHAGSALIHGPFHANFADTYDELHAAGASTEVTDESTLAKAVAELLADPGAQDGARGRIEAFAHAQEDALDALALDLSALMDPV
ncbi:MAG: 3-deoxy-D-manno-octulosonic acid transferase [Pseudomonadota bacterium]|uniref:3-deoxy-D-manno-octulosonic acid transferase n=1 Tax=Roseovarius TaxID=74030 RepID=UPI0022A8135F|nr:3-deoxy-D-manno-octulosonic acid transferase [Roseovarius sp. EGI FJ00037]MCZ0811943.1 3-deoxy-D-manno-octulosonic acid transferase [Roseovarius sp. EGI FJ00037]